jgi:hypothetical protein
MVGGEPTWRRSVLVAESPRLAEKNGSLRGRALPVVIRSPWLWSETQTRAAETSVSGCYFIGKYPATMIASIAVAETRLTRTDGWALLITRLLKGELT